MLSIEKIFCFEINVFEMIHPFRGWRYNVFFDKKFSCVCLIEIGFGFCDLFSIDACYFLCLDANKVTKEKSRTA